MDGGERGWRRVDGQGLLHSASAVCAEAHRSSGRSVDGMGGAAQAKEQHELKHAGEPTQGVVRNGRGGG